MVVEGMLLCWMGVEGGYCFGVGFLKDWEYW